MAHIDLIVKVRWWVRPMIAVLITLVRCGMPGQWAMKILSMVGTRAIKVGFAK